MAGATNSATSTPELLSLEFDYDTPTNVISGWTFPITVGRNNASGIIDNLYTSRAKTTLLAFYPSGDTAQDSYNVKLTNMPSRGWWEEQGRKEGHFQVTVQEIFKG